MVAFRIFWWDPYFFTDDYNRVVLETIEGVSGSDYVNASYVDVSMNRDLRHVRVLINIYGIV